MKRYSVKVEEALATEADGRMVVSIDGPGIRGITTAREKQLARYIEDVLNAALSAFEKQCP